MRSKFVSNHLSLSTYLNFFSRSFIFLAFSVSIFSHYLSSLFLSLSFSMFPCVNFFVISFFLPFFCTGWLCPSEKEHREEKRRKRINMKQSRPICIFKSQRSPGFSQPIAAADEQYISFCRPGRNYYSAKTGSDLTTHKPTVQDCLGFQ